MAAVVATDWLVGGGTLALAVATFLLAAFALRQVVLTRGAVQEAYQARVDDQAPKVTALILRPFSPPFGASSYGNPQPWPPGQKFTMPKDQAQRILVRTQGYLMNEGPTTAVVEVDQSVTFPDPPQYAGPRTGLQPGAIGSLANAAADPATEVDGLPPMSEIVYLKGSRWALLPGRVVAFRHTADYPLRQWVEAWGRRESASPVKSTFEIRVMDQYEHGVEDHHTIEVEAYPVVPAPGNQAAWQIPIAVAGSEGFDRADVLPVQRRYRRVELRRWLPWRRRG
jgi:hypothetical protein